MVHVLLISKKEVAATIVVVLIAASAILAYFNNGAGTLEIKISDPQDLGEATQVCLNYSVIEVHRAQTDNQSGWVKVVDKSDWINLTTVVDVNRTICYANLQAGTYNLIRLRVLDARVTVDGTYLNASVLNGELVTPIPNDIKVNTGQTATLLMEIKVKVDDTKTADSVTLVPEVKVTQT
jgi:hypothetical protein